MKKRKHTTIFYLDFVCAVLWGLCFILNLYKCIDGDLAKWPFMFVSGICAICWGLCTYFNRKDVPQESTENSEPESK